MSLPRPFVEHDWRVFPGQDTARFIRRERRGYFTAQDSRRAALPAPAGATSHGRRRQASKTGWAFRTRDTDAQASRDALWQEPLGRGERKRFAAKKVRESSGQGRGAEGGRETHRYRARLELHSVALRATDASLKKKPGANLHHPLDNLHRRCRAGLGDGSCLGISPRSFLTPHQGDKQQDCTTDRTTCTAADKNRRFRNFVVGQMLKRSTVRT